MKQMKRIIAFICTVLLIIMSVKPCTVSAVSNEENLDKSGILQINVYHIDSDTQEKTLIQSGSGFLISDSSADSQYVITCNHVVSVDSDTEALVKEYLNVDKLNIKIEVVITRDLTENVTVVQASAEADYAILKLDSPIYQRNAMILNPDGPSLTEDVYAMGFPDAIQELQDFTYYSEDEVVVTKGSVSLQEVMSEGVPYIQHSATITAGNSGGPLVDEDGYVVGLNTFVVALGTGTYYYSLSISEITNALDLIGINYQTPDNAGSETTEETDTTEPVEADTTDVATEEPVVEEPAVTVDTSALDEVLTEATKYIESEYTEASYSELQTAIDEAKDIKNKDGVTQTEIDSATGNVQSAIDGLEKDNSLLLIIIIIAAVVVIIVIIIIIIVVSGKKKKEQQRRTPPVVGGTISQPPVFPASTPSLPPQAPAAPQAPVAPQPPVPPTPSRSAGQPYMAAASMGEGAGETSVLGYGSGETSVLGGSNQTKASLTRVKTNEKVDIAKQLFRIGKERNKVDYCITNNNSVSRIHADIVFKNGQYYIIDNNSTNYTFVNGQMIPAKQEVAIANGDRIKLAEEEFLFKMND